MHRSITSFLSVLLVSSLCAQKTYSYKSVPGDPMEARIYTLDNGLQVWLSRNPDAPRMQTNIAVRAGSKNDPADATGLAHYLEHMLFKGTSHFGTADWTKESAVLKRISDQYELRRTTTDEAKRDAIYHVIDSLSSEAARYAVPNEYDKMVKSIGARGTNAFTSNERTVFVNDIPSDELEKWMMIESERFQECVLRLFHTELETVYEEFNRGQDNDNRNAWFAMEKNLYKNHPYGTQTTIGKGEHLKNPSMVKIHEYFDTYYKPNNMALVIAGDLDFDKTIAMADKYFGGWKTGSIPPFSFAGEPPMNGPVTVEVYGPMAEWVDLGWRANGTGTKDPMILELISGLLSNGEAGLIDLDLLQDQKVLDAAAGADDRADYSEFTMHGEPKEGQTLEQVRDLLLGELDRLKQGTFDDWLIQAVVNQKKQQQIRFWNENNGLRAAAMTDAFILKKDWTDLVNYYDRMAGITKQQVMDFAREHLSNDHVCVFKRTGDNKDAFKVSKPKITPIDINRAGMSEWRKNWDKVPGGKLEPRFIDYNAAISTTTLVGDVRLDRVENPTNDLFSLYYIVDMGTNNDDRMDLAMDYLPYLGTATRSAKDLKKDMFRNGVSLNVSAASDRVYVSLSGFQNDLEAGIAMMEDLLANAKADDQALKELVADKAKSREDRKKNKNAVLYDALYKYAQYGPHNPLTDELSNEAMAKVRSAELIDRIHDLTHYPHHIFFYGKMSLGDVGILLRKAHHPPATPKPLPPERTYPENETTTDQVFYVDQDMVQTEMVLQSKGSAFSKEKLPFGALFNEYFGSGLSSIVFQEIREAKALAYGASCSFITPSRKDRAFYLQGYLGTQADKLGDAVTALKALMNDMVMDEKQFQGAKDAALKRIASDRITKERIYWNWDNLKRLGIDHDVRQDNYERIPSITLQDLKGFFDTEVKGRRYNYLVIGKQGSVDMEVLGRLGPVHTMTKEQIFGY